MTSTDRPLANNKNKDEKKIHPCLRCGACCAHFRVSFYWREAEADDHATAVPRELTEDINDRYRAMKGTERRHRPVCVALQGRIGVDAHCSIYKWRPSPCRNFAPSFERGENGENGVKNPRCDEARAAHGLPPLSREDWSGLNTDR